MKNMKRMIAGALGVATVGAFAAQAAVAKAETPSAPTTIKAGSLIINPADLIKEPMFAEYHQEGYTRELDRSANWGIWKGINPIILNPILKP